jgi:hypothetical protein
MSIYEGIALGADGDLVKKNIEKVINNSSGCVLGK